MSQAALRQSHAGNRIFGAQDFRASETARCAAVDAEALSKEFRNDPSVLNKG